MNPHLRPITAPKSKKPTSGVNIAIVALVVAGVWGGLTLKVPEPTNSYMLTTGVLKKEFSHDPSADEINELLKNGEYNHVLIHFDRALQENPKNNTARLVQAEIHLMQGDFSAAEKILQEAVSINPNDLRVQAMLTELREIAAER